MIFNLLSQLSTGCTIMYLNNDCAMKNCKADILNWIEKWLSYQKKIGVCSLALALSQCHKAVS